MTTTPKTLSAEQVERALLDPAAVFKCPSDVIQAEGVTQARKIEILRRWEYDVREQEVAQEENMRGDMRVVLSNVLDALKALGAATGHPHSSPTKQGGQ